MALDAESSASVTADVPDTMTGALSVTPLTCSFCRKPVGEQVYYPMGFIRELIPGSGVNLIDRMPSCETCHAELGATRSIRFPRCDRTKRCGGCARTVHSAGHRRFCSRACASRARRAWRREGKRCVVCHDYLTPTRSDARYCSSACRQRGYRQRTAAGRVTP